MTARRRRIPSESNSVPLAVGSHGPFLSFADSDGFIRDEPKQSLIRTLNQEDENPRMARDRTAEFGSAVRSLQGRQIMRATSVRDVKKVKMLQSYGEFMMVAKSIGKNIASTYTKLEKLTLRESSSFYRACTPAFNLISA